MAVSPPTDLIAYTHWPYRIRVEWINPAYPDNYDGVFIERKIGAGAWVKVLEDTYPNPLPSYWDDYNVEDGTLYTYRVTGYIDDPYEESAASNEAYFITMLGPATGLWGTADPTSLQIHWEDNSQNESGFKVYRKREGGAYALVDTVGQNVIEHESTGLDEGTWYYFKVKAYNALTESGYSQEFGIMTGDPPDAPSNGVAQGISTSQINLGWQDNSNNEDGFRIYEEQFVVTAANKYINFSEGGGELTAILDEGTYGAFDLGIEIKLQMDDAGALTYSGTYDRTTRKFTIAASGVFSLLWNTGTNKAVDISTLCGYSDAADDTGAATYTSDSAVDPWTLISTKGVNVTAHSVTGLPSGAKRYYRVSAYNDSGESDRCTEFHSATVAAISPPSNVIAIPVSDTEIDVHFQDNSSEEDLHEVAIYDHTLPGWLTPVELPANVTGFRMTGLTKGHFYAFHPRAKQGVTYSEYAEYGAGAKTIEEPAAPSALALSEISNDSMRLTWTDNQVDGYDSETGFKIERSTNGVDYSEIAVVGQNVVGYLAQGLSASTQYWFRVRAYNAAGNSAYCAVADDTTLAAYVLTAFEKLLRKKNPNFTFLVEVNPKITISGFSLTAAQTYTYEVAIAERGIDTTSVLEAGAVYTEQSSIATVEANASSFWFDYYNRTLYVHTSDGTSPNNFLIEGGFWLYFSNRENINFNDNNYLALFKQENASDLSQDIKPYYEGDFGVSAGTISLINGNVGGEPYFDKLYTKYTWENAMVILLAGGENFTYSQFEPVFTCMIDEVAIEDRLFEINLMDLRMNMERNVPLYKYTLPEFPNLDSGAVDSAMQEYFGTYTDVPATCIDTVNHIFKFNRDRVGSVTAVKRNDTTLVLDTDYYVDLQRAMIFLDEDTPWVSQDKILVSFTGKVDSAGDLITNGAEIFKYVMNNYYVLADSELDLDSIYKTKYDNTATLRVPIYQEKPVGDVLRNLEHTLRAYSFQDARGRIGIKSALTAAPSNIKYVRNDQIFGSPRRVKNLKSKYWAVDVFYSEDPATQLWSSIRKEDHTARKRFRTEKDLPIYTYLSTEADALSLGSEIMSLLNKDSTEVTVDSMFFSCLAGDLIYFNRNRFYSSSGSANDLLMRIIKIDKGISSNRTALLVEEV